jgi:hypothetical protein
MQCQLFLTGLGNVRALPLSAVLHVLRLLASLTGCSLGLAPGSPKNTTGSPSKYCAVLPL